METIHGIDVSWMKHCQKDHNARPIASRKDLDEKPTKQNGNTQQTDLPREEKEKLPEHSQKPEDPLPKLPQSTSTEKPPKVNGEAKATPQTAPTPQPSARRGSWLSSFSSKFSATPGAHHTASPSPVAAPAPPAKISTASADDIIEKRPAGPACPRNAVLPHAAKPEGDGPYVPAPPKQNQPSFLTSAFRRLSSGGGTHTGSHTPSLGSPAAQHGLCERKVFNVDRNRERCCIGELKQSKLRRVAFCVDVEITATPKYDDENGEGDKGSKKEKKRISEKGEGDALKGKIGGKEVNGDVESAETDHELKETPSEEKGNIPPAPEKEPSKKKEKKKRSEEERKTRKEKKRKLAEANGTLPVELVRDSTEASDECNGNPAPTTQATPTIDPARIYRRCCQLRESPILKKLTEQLSAPSVMGSQDGIVKRLDLTNYVLQLADLITLGDYLAVVPVKELIMVNCGLTDEGVRVILAGLLAAKPPCQHRKRGRPWGEVIQGGVIEKLVLKNNARIGTDGWRCICLFINMCRSLKSLELSQIPFPKPVEHSTSQAHNGTEKSKMVPENLSNISALLSKSLSERLAGPGLELLNLGECGLNASQLGHLIDGAIASKLRRLGIAGNDITSEGMQHVARYLRGGTCEGLDIGGNDLRNLLGVIADMLTEDSELFALSLADCNLTPDSLWTLFPALVKLKNFRFIDLSQNHELFEGSPSALCLLRRYLPRFPILKRIHLTDVGMTPEQAIALAEILPESPTIAHVNILENSQIARLADAQDEATQEEACALYASLMAAVRVSKTIICIDVDVPSPGSSDIVKALAKQVVAYCLWNMERGPVAEISETAAAISEPHDVAKGVTMPDVLLDLVGHAQGVKEIHDDAEPAPDEDYVIGGTGVVKALDICLKNKGVELRPASGRPLSSDGGTTPITPIADMKAKDMSKNLLDSARKIRARLQPALVKESKGGDHVNYMRLLFLDNTLSGMIKRFEDEYPETRVAPSIPLPPTATLSPISPTGQVCPQIPAIETDSTALFAENEEEPDTLDDELKPPPLRRHDSDVSIAGKALSLEEGRMHRFGQKIRRDITRPDLEADHDRPPSSSNSSSFIPGPGQDSDTEASSVSYPSSHSTRAPPEVQEKETAHSQQEVGYLRAMLEEMKGEEMRQQIESKGEEEVLRELGSEGGSNEDVLELRRRVRDMQEPEVWERFLESQRLAKVNNEQVQDTKVG